MNYLSIRFDERKDENKCIRDDQGNACDIHNCQFMSCFVSSSSAQITYAWETLLANEKNPVG